MKFFISLDKFDFKKIVLLGCIIFFVLVEHQVYEKLVNSNNSFTYMDNFNFDYIVIIIQLYLVKLLALKMSISRLEIKISGILSSIILLILTGNIVYLVFIVLFYGLFDSYKYFAQKVVFWAFTIVLISNTINESIILWILIIPVLLFSWVEYKRVWPRILIMAMVSTFIVIKNIDVSIHSIVEVLTIFSLVFTMISIANSCLKFCFWLYNKSKILKYVFNIFAFVCIFSISTVYFSYEIYMLLKLTTRYYTDYIVNIMLLFVVLKLVIINLVYSYIKIKNFIIRLKIYFHNINVVTFINLIQLINFISVINNEFKIPISKRIQKIIRVKSFVMWILTKILRVEWVKIRNLKYL